MFDSGQILDGQHGVRHTETREKTPDDLPGRAIGLDEAQHMIALLREPEQRLRNHVDTRGGDETVVAVLQRGERQLELARRRVRGAQVVEAGPLAAQAAHGLLNRIELELHGLVDRGDDRVVVRRNRHVWWMIDASLLLHVFLAGPSENPSTSSATGKR